MQGPMDYAQNEIARLTALVAELAERLREVGKARDDAKEIIRDLLASGVEFDDSRLNYLTVQVDRETWREAKELTRGSEWQPLATAPRDGTKILICRTGRAHEPVIVWFHVDHFTSDTAGDVEALLRYAQGVLWHPLPEMPQQEKRKA